MHAYDGLILALSMPPSKIIYEHIFISVKINDWIYKSIEKNGFFKSHIKVTSKGKRYSLRCDVNIKKNICMKISYFANGQVLLSQKQHKS